MSSLDAYETLSYAFVRAVPGALSVSFGGGEEGGVSVDPRRLTGGVDGVQRLCKAFLSAVFMESALEGWSEELVAVSFPLFPFVTLTITISKFFLDLWTQMNSDATLQGQVEKCPLLPQLVVKAEDVPTSTVFEEMISRYTKVVVRAEDMIVQQICGEVESNFRAHLNAVTSYVSMNTAE